MSVLKKIHIAIVTIGILIIGYLRDYIFVHINYQLGYLWNGNESFYNQESIDLLGSFSYYQLYFGKYGLTIVFSLIYLGCCLYLFRLLFKKFELKLILYIYGCTIFISLLIFMIGYFIQDTDLFYPISRYIMGFVQSPILIAILYFAQVIFDQKEHLLYASKKEHNPQG